MGFGNRQRGGNGRKQQYDNTNRWVLFDNDRKRSDKDADFTGTINIDGVDYWLNGWEGKGKSVASGSVKRKDDARREAYDRNRGGGYRDDAPPPRREGMRQFDDRDMPPVGAYDRDDFDRA